MTNKSTIHFTQNLKMCEDFFNIRGITNGTAIL